MERVIENSIKSVFICLFLIVALAAEAKMNIPNKVEKAFKRKYPNAQDVLWKKYLENQYLAIFIENDEEVNVFINDKGEFVESHVELNEDHIPRRITERLAELPEGWKVNYILKMVTSGEFQYYRAKVQYENNHYEFIFDQNEVLVSVQTIE